MKKGNFDKNGYDENGYNMFGFDVWGFNAKGYNMYTGSNFDNQGFDKRGFNAEGFDRKGFDKEGYNKEGYDSTGLNREGYDKRGFNAEGFDKEGFNLFGRDNQGFDKTGFNAKGYDKEGYNKRGCNKEGYNRYGYDKRGFDKEGYNKEGYNRYGYDKEGFNKAGINGAGYDKEGFNKNGWNIDNINKDTGIMFDKDGWDRFGISKDTGTTFDKEGFNILGFDENNFNRRGFNKQGINKYTRDLYDKEGFNAKGIHRDMIADMLVPHSSLDIYDNQNKKKSYSGLSSAKASKMARERLGFSTSKEGFTEYVVKNVYNSKDKAKITGKEIEKVEYKLVVGKNGIMSKVPCKINKKETILPVKKKEVKKQVYDKAGFDEDGIHISTGTRYNREGRTKNETTIPVKEVKAREVKSIQYQRDNKVVKSVLNRSNYSCEYDKSHLTFTSRGTDKQYMEVHHIIPMSKQDLFNENIDIVENTVSLCPNCHRAIHMGAKEVRDSILTKLYRDRELSLKKSSIKITLERLLNFYD